MTAQHVVDMAQRPHPVIWILHEWWDDEMIKENLRIRNLAGLNLDTVKQALKKASCVVFVCEAQRSLYNPQANSAVIYVGVPTPLYQPDPLKALTLKRKLFTFLCLGIVCPRKNQVWAIELFREFAGDRKDVRLLVVGARYTRDYEIQYVEEVKRAINGDLRIELLNVTENVEQYYEVYWKYVCINLCVLDYFHL
jgi:glycosyltransferase involved in cell wall biosynthesis